MVTKRRVVVTGIGLLTPLGIGVKENWTNLLAGKSGTGALDSEEYKSLPCRIAAKIDSTKLNDFLAKSSSIKKSEIKSMSMANLYSLIAADEAIKNSGWTPNENEDLFRAGTSIATGMAGIQEVAEASLLLDKKDGKGFKAISPYFIPKILPNLSSGLISIRYKLKGPNHCVTTACAAGAHAISDAYKFIKSGIVDVMVCGASEACIHPVSIAGFGRMRALATKFNDKPSVASRPFDLDRDGFIMSEGAGCLILEDLEHVKKRNAESKIYAEIVGTGFNADANHITNPSPDGDGAYRCMKMALNEGNIKPSELNYINAHATSTPVGDIAEYTAIKRLLNDEQQGKRKHEVYVSSVKGSLGHLLGAAGAVESAFTVLACKERTLPASINIFNLDPNFKSDETNLKIIQNEPVKLRDSNESSEKVYFLKNSFGFGGTNCSILFTNYKD